MPKQPKKPLCHHSKMSRPSTLVTSPSHLTEGRPKGPETQGFQSPRTAMKEGLDATEIGSQNVTCDNNQSDL